MDITPLPTIFVDCVHLDFALFLFLFVLYLSPFLPIPSIPQSCVCCVWHARPYPTFDRTLLPVLPAMSLSLKAELETWAAALKAYDEQDFDKALDLFSVRFRSLDR